MMYRFIMKIRSLKLVFAQSYSFISASDSKLSHLSLLHYALLSLQPALCDIVPFPHKIFRSISPLRISSFL